MPLPRLLRRILPLVLLVPALSSAKDRGELTVLSYHEIADKADALTPAYAVTPTNFLRQMDWLRNHGYRFIGIDDLLAARAGKRPLPPKAVLVTFDELRHLAPNPDIAELALWLHDVIWEPMRDDCEQRSVEWAMNHLPALPALILETRHLKASSVTADAAVVRDADLSILAAGDDAYDAYEHAIRAEYAMLPTAQFRAGRSTILADFASRRPLFFTPLMQAREPRARANLARSLARLEA